MHLGKISQPLLIFGGPYSNLQATIAVKAEAEKLNIGPDHVICTGDIVAYCGQPEETVDLIQQWGIHVLMGNCEESFAVSAENCGCGFSEGSNCDLLSAEWFSFADSKLRTDQRQWFAQLPRSLSLNFFNKKLHFIHGSISCINEFIFYSSPESTFRAQLQQTDADIIIAGHCGIPFTKKIQRKLWHNTGAIGMPANDGTQRTWFSVITAKDKCILIESRALNYDHLSTRTSMLSAGLSNTYAETLRSGLWPSMDTLPEKEKLQCGKPLPVFKMAIS